MNDATHLPMLLQTILAQDEPQGSGLLSLLIILIPMGAILYMTIIPQRKQRQRHADMLRTLDVGDEVMTTGGIIGVITHAEDDVYHVEIDTDVVIRVSKAAIARNMAEPDPAARPAGRRGLLGGAAAGGGTGAAAEADAAPDVAEDKDK